MKDDPPSVVAARAEVERSRARMIATLGELQQQFTPHNLVMEAWESAKEKGAELAEEAVDAARARPLAATGIAAAIVMFLAREPLIDLGCRAMGGLSAKRTPRPKRSKRKQSDNRQADNSHDDKETVE